MSYDDTHIGESDAKRINALFVGRKVKKVSDTRLVLDDGTALTIVPNEGCGGCSAGWYDLKSLNDCDNVITRAEVVEEKLSDDEWDEERRYGTGFEIVVERADEAEAHTHGR